MLSARRRVLAAVRLSMMPFPLSSKRSKSLRISTICFSLRAAVERARGQHRKTGWLRGKEWRRGHRTGERRAQQAGELHSFVGEQGVIACEDFLQIEVATAQGEVVEFNNTCGVSERVRTKEERIGLNLSSLSRAEKTRSTSILSAEPATVAAPLFLSSSSKALNSSAHSSTSGSGEETRKHRQGGQANKEKANLC